jgi:hypothetical protein
MREATLWSCFGRLDVKESRYVDGCYWTLRPPESSLADTKSHLCLIIIFPTHLTYYLAPNTLAPALPFPFSQHSKVHFLLVSTLNSAYPDHDFSFLRPDHFTREPSPAQVLAHVSGNLLGTSGIGVSS